MKFPPIADPECWHAIVQVSIFISVSELHLSLLSCLQLVVFLAKITLVMVKNMATNLCSGVPGGGRLIS